MKLLCLILTITALSVHAQQQQTTTIYLIRHAEKADASPDPTFLLPDRKGQSDGRNSLRPKTFR